MWHSVTAHSGPTWLQGRSGLSCCIFGDCRHPLLAVYNDAVSQFSHIVPLHQAFYTYWQDHCCKGGRVKEKDISLRALKSILPNLIKIRKTPDGPQYSVIGTNVIQEYGKNFTGLFVSEQPHEICKKADFALIKRMENQSSLVISFGYFCYPGKHYLRVMNSCFALISDDGRISGYLLLFTVDRGTYLEKMYDPIDPVQINTGKADVVSQQDFDHAMAQYNSLSL